MTEKELTDVMKDSLARVLGFFPRVDTLLSVLLAINLGLLAVISSNAPAPSQLGRETVFAILYLILSSISFYHLYKCAFPKLEGGHTSLIYFREIASKSVLKYGEELREMSAEKYLDDLIEQTWRNSTILKEKFDHIRLAFIFLVLSLIFWLPALLKFASNNTERFLAK
jgi:hypothetical protein